jgi:hypothetical protein
MFTMSVTGVPPSILVVTQTIRPIAEHTEASKWTKVVFQRNRLPRGDSSDETREYSPGVQCRGEPEPNYPLVKRWEAH